MAVSTTITTAGIKVNLLDRKKKTWIIQTALFHHRGIFVSIISWELFETLANSIKVKETEKTRDEEAYKPLLEDCVDDLMEKFEYFTKENDLTTRSS